MTPPKAPFRQHQPAYLNEPSCRLRGAWYHKPALKSIGVHPVPCPVNGKRKYRLDLEKSNDNIHGLDSLSEEINMSGYQVSLVENMLNMLLDVVPRYIARTGHSVRIGNLLTLKPFATGTLEYANDAPNRLNRR